MVLMWKSDICIQACKMFGITTRQVTMNKKEKVYTIWTRMNFVWCNNNFHNSDNFADKYYIKPHSATKWSKG